MSPLVIGLTTFACSSGAAFAGLILHAKLPVHHLDAESKDVVKLVMGLVATMSALVLGLLIASAQSSYNIQSGNLQKLTADVAMLDHVLQLYGPETEDSRELLRQAVAAAHDQIWSPSGVQAQNLDPRNLQSQADRFFYAVQSLAPKTEAQRFALAQASQLSAAIGQTRSLMFQEASNPVSWPFLVVLVFWICVLFLGFGLFARFHATVAVTLLVGSLSVAAAIFLIMELGNPYTGLIQLSDEPLRGVLAHIGQN